jgi:O-antigen/teichoic acid export membrane protein
VALLGAAGISLISGVVVSMIVARAVGAAEFGFFALVATLLPIARDMVDLGTANVAAKIIANEPDCEPEELSQLLSWRLVPALAAAIAIIALALTQDDSEQGATMAIAGLAVLLYVNSGYVAAFQARRQLAIPAMVTIVTQLITVAACAILAIGSAPPLGFVAAIIGRECVSMLLLRGIAQRMFQLRPKLHFGIQSWRSRYRDLGAIAAAALAYQLAIGSGAIIVSLDSTAEELGWYGAAFRLAAPMFALAWVIASPCVPQLASGAQAGITPFRSSLINMTEIPLAAAAAGAGFAFVAAPQLIILLFGESFSPAVPILQWLAIAIAANTGAAFMATGLIAAGRNAAALVLGVATLTSAASLSVIAVHAYGAVGAAYALVATSLLGFAAAGVAAVGWSRTLVLGGKAVAFGLLVALAGATIPVAGLAGLSILACFAIAVAAASLWWTHA